MNNLIGLSTSYFATKGYSIYESVSRIVKMGFNTVEIGAAHEYENNIWRTLGNIKIDFPAINFTIHNLFPPLKEKIWFNPSHGLTKANINIIDNLFKSALILKALLVGIHPPILNEVFVGDKIVGNFNMPIMGDHIDKDNSWGNFITMMDYAYEKSKHYGIRLLIENMDTTFVNTSLSTEKDFKMLFHRYPSTGLLLDMGHAMLCGKVNELTRLHKYIFELHIHDTGKVTKESDWAHLAVKDKSYFIPLKKIILNNRMPIIFEHGANVSEDEIVREKELMETVASIKETQEYEGCYGV